MTTHTVSAVIDGTTDAGFRAWYGVIRAGIAAVGWSQKADTGQLNPATMVRPAINSAAGYEIWQSPNGSLVLKIEPGAASSTQVPQCWCTFGKASDGAGALTGATSTRNTIFYTSTPASTAVAYPSFFTGSNDHLGMLLWGLGAASGTRHMAFVLVGKTVDSDGVATTIGFGVARCTGLTSAMNLQCVRTDAVAGAQTESAFFSQVPGNPVSSLTQAGNNQIYQWQMNMPEVLPFLWAGTVVKAETSLGLSITTNLVGQTPRTYACMNNALDSQLNVANSNNGYGFAMLWE